MKATTVLELPSNRQTGFSGLSATRSCSNSRRTWYSRSYHCGHRQSVSTTDVAVMTKEPKTSQAHSDRAGRRLGTIVAMRRLRSELEVDELCLGLWRQHERHEKERRQREAAYR